MNRALRVVPARTTDGSLSEPTLIDQRAKRTGRLVAERRRAPHQRDRPQRLIRRLHRRRVEESGAAD